MSGAFPFILPFQLSDIGAPLSNGELSTFDIGTSDPKPTFRDYARTQANTNPIILNSAGRFRCYLGVGGYKFVLRDSQGNLIWTEEYDNVGGSGGGSFQVVDTIANLRAAAAGSTDYAEVMGYYDGGDIGARTYQFDSESEAPDDGGGVIAPNEGAGRWILLWDGTPVSPRVFGAKGDGSFNDAPALLAAQAWAAAMNLKSGIQFTHVPVFYNLGNDAIQITVFASSLPGSLFRVPVNGMTFTGGFDAGPYPVIYGASSSVAGMFGGTRLTAPACPEWYGAIGNGATDDLDAIAYLFASGPNFMAFPSSQGYACSEPPYEGTPAPLIILAAGQVVNLNTDEVYIEVGITISGKYIGGSAEFVTAFIETLTATFLNAENAAIGTLNVTTILNALTAVISGTLTSGPAKVKGGTSAVLGSVPSRRYVNPVAVNNVGATEQALRSFPVVADILDAVGAEIEFEAFGSFAANTNTKSVKLTLIDPIATESVLVALALTPGAATAYTWRMKGKVTIRSATEYLLFGKGAVFIASSNEALVFTDAGNTITAELANAGLTPIPDPTVVADVTVTAVLAPHTVRSLIKAAIGVAAPGDTLNNAVTVRLLAQGAVSNDITCDYFTVNLNPSI